MLAQLVSRKTTHAMQCYGNYIITCANKQLTPYADCSRNVGNSSLKNMWGHKVFKKKLAKLS
jgi:hypothetical protein